MILRRNGQYGTKVKTKEVMAWDDGKATIEATHEWWEKNPRYGKFRHKGLPFANELSVWL